MKVEREVSSGGFCLPESERMETRGHPTVELLGKSKEELRAYCKMVSEPVYRGEQIYRALYAERRFDLGAVTTLPAALREKLLQEATVTLPTVRQRYLSSDGSVRYLFRLGEKPKPAAVEAVFMPSEGWQTICISTQAGCAVDCQFCLTAQLGLIRNLTAGEIVGQVLVPLAEMGVREPMSSSQPEPTEKDYV